MKIIKFVFRPFARILQKIAYKLNSIFISEMHKEFRKLKSEVQGVKGEVQDVKGEVQGVKENVNSLQVELQSLVKDVDISVEQFRQATVENDCGTPVFAKYNGRNIVVSPCDPRYCTTCLACLNICPMGAIQKSQDDEGFYTIKIDSEKCIGCKKCIEVCHVNKPKEIFQRTPRVLLAAKSSDDELRNKSSSGGLFSLFAKEIFNQNGIVFGAAFDDSFIVRHISIEDEKNLYKLQGSKYVQSDAGKTFSQVKELLAAGRKVLYSGTPCQIAGLRNFVGIQPNLFTIDVVCHGVPSPKFFEDYKAALQKQYGKIVSYDFRCKKSESNSFQPLGWKEYGIRVDFDSDTVLYKTRLDDIYMKGFLQEFTNRPVCHRCPYACGKRVGDITLGDFWGYENTDGNLEDDDKGISALLINSEKGQRLFESIKEKISYFERNFKVLQERNRPLGLPSLLNPDREKFWNDYKEFGFDYACSRWFK